MCSIQIYIESTYEIVNKAVNEQPYVPVNEWNEARVRAHTESLWIDDSSLSMRRIENEGFWVSHIGLGSDYGVVFKRWTR